MSWFFGKKKHKDSPPSTPEEEPAPGDEGYVFVEKRNQPDADNNTPSLYPSLSGVTPYPVMPSSVVKQNSQDNAGHDLTRIPFKFCRDLERKINEDLVIDKLRLDEIESFINRTQADNYDYKFQLERSVLNELDSQNEE